MNHPIKKITALLLALTLFATLFTGCEKEPQPLRVLPDVSEETAYSRTDEAVRQLLREIAAEGGPTDVEVEYLPQTGTERETAITHLRAEIMGGKGPDLFIISGGYWSDGEAPGDSPLFPFPEKSMVNRLFLPLDEYMENAKYAFWDEFHPAIMEVGRTDKGQVLVPLSYTFPITCFRRFDVSHTHSRDRTWDDMLADETLVMKAAAMLETGGKNMIFALDNPNFDCLMGKTANYPAEELLFTEDELLECVHKQLELDETDPASLDGLPEYFHTYAQPWYANRGESEGRLPPSIERGTDLAVIPQYNKDGGVTATVFHYACINANTKRGADAFFVLDYLLSRDGSFHSVDGSGNSYMLQESWRQDFYSLFTADGLPIDRGVTWNSVNEGGVSSSNRSSIEAAAHCVTAVNVHSNLNKELAQMMQDCRDIAQGRQDGDVGETVRETYRVMRMELAES